MPASIRASVRRCRRDSAGEGGAGGQAAVLAAEVKRRRGLPVDRGSPVGELSEVTGDARAQLNARRGKNRGAHGTVA